jgi:hypothetical protein
MAETPIAVWRLMAHHECPEEAARWMEQTGILAIGWGNIGDIRKKGLGSPPNISRAIRESYPHATNFGSGGVCLHHFFTGVEVGDLVIVGAPGRRLAVMEVTGDYEFDKIPTPKSIGDYRHQRSGVSLQINPDRLWREAGTGPIKGQSIRWALIECAHSINLRMKQQLTRV